MAIMLGAVMLLMWLAGSLLVYGLLGVALLIGAAITPTDPVVASSIVTGEIPQRLLPAALRDLLSAESGANDGLAYPIVSLPILALTAASPLAAASEWALRAVVWEVGFAVGFGVLLGWGAGRLLHWAEAQGMIDKPSFLSYAIALARVTLGATRTLGSDGILAVFVAGVAFNRAVSATERAQEERFTEALDRFFYAAGVSAVRVGPAVVAVGGVGMAAGTAGARHSAAAPPSGPVGAPPAAAEAQNGGRRTVFGLVRPHRHCCALLRQLRRAPNGD